LQQISADIILIISLSHAINGFQIALRKIIKYRLFALW